MTSEGRKAEDLINAIIIYEDGSIFEDNKPNLHELAILNPKFERDHLFASTEYKLIRNTNASTKETLLKLSAGEKECKLFLSKSNVAETTHLSRSSKYYN